MSSKKRKRAIFGMFLVLLFALSMTGVGCSNSSANASSASNGENNDSKSGVPSAAEAAAADEASAEKPSKDGFDNATNRVINIAGVDFQIPDYFGDKNDKDVFYAETGEGVTMLQIMDADASKTTRDEFEKGKFDIAKSYVEGVLKGVDEAGEPVIGDQDVAGHAGARFELNFKMKGVSAKLIGVHFFDEGTKRVGAIILTQSDQSKYDYFADFDKIIASATDGEIKSGAPTLGSTIDYDGLSIELGDSLQSTTLQNQFSEKNGTTVIYFPVKVTNNSDSATHLNAFAIKAFGSKGTELDTVFTYFDDDARMAGDMRPGASQEANLYFPYDGDGTYYLDFGIFKNEVEVEIPVQL